MSKREQGEQIPEPPIPAKKCRRAPLDLLIIKIGNQRLTLSRIIPVWREIISCPTNGILDRSFQVLTQNNHVLFISRNSNAIYSLDIGNTMGRFKKLLDTQSIGGSGAILHGLLYIVCGWKSDDGISSLIECYDLQAETRLYKYIPKMKYLRSGIGLVAQEATGRLFVIGGYNEETNQVVSKVEAYSANENTWTELRCMKYPRYRPAVVVYQDSVYVIGGYVEKGKSYMERYDSEENTWKLVVPLSVMYAKVEVAEVSAIVYEGRIVAFGVTPRSEVIIEEYDPADNKWSLVNINCCGHTPILCDGTHIHNVFENSNSQPLSAFGQ